MARVLVPVYFDYASTLCYIAWRIVRELEQELGFEALWKGVPIALRDLGARAGKELGKREREKILLVAAETGIRVAPPKRWLDSKRALLGSEVAREENAFAAYHDSVFRAAFEEHRNIGEWSVLESIASRAGIDAARFRAAVASKRGAALIEEHKREADRFSAFGYPTFILGDFTLTGIQPKESMRLLLARYIERRVAEPGS
jgi:predicted DsbA family dithiol-disulfide isomerase